jgi:hypothetical protein
MFFAVALSKLTAPCTSFTTEVVLSAEYELSSDLLVDRLATVLVAKSFDLVTALDEDESRDEVMSVLFALLEDSANCEALSNEADCANCEALEDDLLVAKLSVVAVFAVRLLLEERSRLAVNDLLLDESLAFVFAAFLVAFAATAGPVTLVSLLAVPAAVVVAVPLVAVLLFDEAPLLVALPSVSAAAKFRLEPKPDVLLLECVLAAVASREAEAVFALLASSAAFVAKAFVVALDLLEFAAAEADSVADKLLLALASCIWLLVLSKLLAELLLLMLVSLNDLLSVVEWFSEESRLEEKLLVLVTSEVLLTVSWLFFPRW